MSIAEPEEEFSSRWILLSLVVVGILLLVGIAAFLTIPLQPSLGGGSTSVTGGTVIMPSGVGINQKLTFDPAVITVIVGVNNTVTFKNVDNNAPDHTVTARDNSFNSGNIKPGGSWTYTFTTPGNFSYYCLYHSWMKGTVIVKAS